MNLVETLLIIFGGPALIIFISWYIGWYQIKKNQIQISFNQFYSIYKNTPSSYWEINESYYKNKYSVRYETHIEKGPFYYYNGMKDIYFKTLLDLIKFRIFVYKYKRNNKKIQNDKIKQRLDKDTADLMANWTKDIERTRKNNMKELQKMIEENATKAEEYKRRLEKLKKENLN